MAKPFLNIPIDNSIYFIDANDIIITVSCLHGGSIHSILFLIYICKFLKISHKHGDIYILRTTCMKYLFNET